MDKLEKNNKNIYIVIALIVCLIVIGLGIVITLRIMKAIDSYEDRNKNYLAIYVCDNDIVGTKSDSCKEKYYNIEVQSKKAKFIKAVGKEIVLYYDKTLKVYDHTKKEIIDTKINNSSYYFDLNINEEENELYGFVFRIDDDYSYFDMASKKVLYPHYNRQLLIIGKDYISSEREEGGKLNSLLLSTKEEKELITILDENYRYIFDVVETELGTYILSNVNDLVVESSIIYDVNYEPITERIYTNMYDISKKGELYVYDNNEVTVYNPQGEVVKKYNVQGNVQRVFTDFYLTVVNNELVIKKYDNDEVIKLIDWDESKYVFKLLSKYAESGYELDKPGYYFIIGDINNKNDSCEDNKCEYNMSYCDAKEIYYNLESNEVQINDSHRCEQ